MRIKAKNNYDKTIEEIKGHYERLVDSSNKLRQIAEKAQQELDDIMNKKIGTGPEFKALLTCTETFLEVSLFFLNIWAMCSTICF